MHFVLLILCVNAISFGIAFAAAVLLREIMARPWQRSVGAHWIGMKGSR
jgi:hypothetical protein